MDERGYGGVLEGWERVRGVMVVGYDGGLCYNGVYDGVSEGIRAINGCVSSIAVSTPTCQQFIVMVGVIQ